MPVVPVADGPLLPLMPSLGQPWLLAGLALWAALALVAMGSLGARHTAAMPARNTQVAPPDVRSAFARLQADRGQRLLVHVIATDCSCAQRLTRHLLQRPRLAGTVELLLLVGPDAAWQPLAEAAGVAIHRVDAATLQQRYGLDAAPVLVALAPGGRIDYLGGYFDHPAALHPLDESIHARWAGGAGAPAALPVYGCAVSDSLRRSIDPLGVLDGPHRPQ